MMDIQEWRSSCLSHLSIMIDLVKDEDKKRIQKLRYDIINNDNPDHQNLSDWQIQFVKIFFNHDKNSKTTQALLKLNPSLKL